MLLIIEQLDRHDKFFLAQTCAVMRTLVSYDFKVEIGKLSYSDRLDFFTGLAYVLPNHYVCAAHCRLHHIKPWSTPIRGNSRAGYRVKHHHVQLALKYTRLGNINREYLEALMAPFSHRSTNGWHAYAAQPRIVNERFILANTWVFGNDRIAASKNTIGARDLRLCPHVILALPRFGGRWSPESQPPSFQFEHIINMAFQHREEELYHACFRCPMDYSVHVSHDGMAVIRSWHDLGTYGSPLDLSWTVHRQSAEPRPSLQPFLHHISGSIRELYMKGGG